MLFLSKILSGRLRSRWSWFCACTVKLRDCGVFLYINNISFTRKGLNTFNDCLNSMRCLFKIYTSSCSCRRQDEYGSCSLLAPNVVAKRNIHNLNTKPGRLTYCMQIENCYLVRLWKKKYVGWIKETFRVNGRPENQTRALAATRTCRKLSFRNHCRGVIAGNIWWDHARLGRVTIFCLGWEHRIGLPQNRHPWIEEWNGEAIIPITELRGPLRKGQLVSSKITSP